VPDSPNTLPSARCPHCDHVFELVEVTDEWCASCGKKIPEVILKDVRPKPHLRKPLPLPPPTREENAGTAGESRGRAVGLFLMFGGVAGGLGCLLWGVISKMSGESLTPVLWTGGLVLALFVTGLAMFTSGRVD
jgi:hypothetical protein